MKATRDFTEITVFGARGHSVMILRELEVFWQGRVRVRALIDDIENGFDHPVLGLPVISSADRLRDHPDLPVLIAVGSGALRARLAGLLAAQGATLATEICAPRPNLDPGAVFGPGTLCMPYVEVGPNVRIGALAQVASTVVGHDVTVGDNVTLGYHTVILGHVEIGDDVNLAARSVVTNGRRDRPRRIGAGADVGVGAVVVQDVAPGERLIGNPAMPIRDWVRLRRLLRPQGG